MLTALVAAGSLVLLVEQSLWIRISNAAHRERSFKTCKTRYAIRRAKVPVVGVTETEPTGMTYQDWMLTQLTDLQKALAQPST